MFLSEPRSCSLASFHPSTLSVVEVKKKYSLAGVVRDRETTTVDSMWSPAFMRTQQELDASSK